MLDIDSLDRSTLHRLHEFVTGESLISNKKSSSPSSKRPRTHYTERSTDRKIRQLEKTLQKFKSGMVYLRSFSFLFFFSLYNYR